MPPMPRSNLPVPSGPVPLFSRRNLPAPSPTLLQQILVVQGGGGAGLASGQAGCCEQIVALLKIISGQIASIEGRMQGIRGSGRAGGTPGDTRDLLGRLGILAILQRLSQFVPGGSSGVAAVNIMGGPVLGGLTLAATIAANALRGMAERLQDTNFKFAEFSGAMTRVQVQAEMAQMFLSQQRGERRAGAARILSEGLAELNQAVAPIGDATERALSVAAGKAASFFTQQLKPLTDVANIVNRILDKIEGYKPNQGITEEQFWKELLGRDHVKFQNHGRPRRFGQIPLQDL